MNNITMWWCTFKCKNKDKHFKHILPEGQIKTFFITFTPGANFIKKFRKMFIQLDNFRVLCKIVCCYTSGLLKTYEIIKEYRVYMTIFMAIYREIIMQCICINKTC